jgi:uncharacterized lipoprotein YmbA
MKNNIISIIFLALTTPLLTSCLGEFLEPKEDLTEFYLMRPTNNIAKVNLESPLKINILPITTPSYMARNQIVSLSQDGTVELSEFNRWAESAQSNFTRVLIDNICATSDNVDVFAYPSLVKDGMNLRIYINDCIGTLGGSLIFKGKWLADSVDSTKQIAKDFSIKVDCGKTYKSYVEAIDKAMVDLAFDIVNTISSNR